MLHLHVFLDDQLEKNPDMNSGDKLLPPRAMSTNSVRTAKNGAGGGSPATVLTVLLILLLLGGMVAIVLRRDGWLNEGKDDTVDGSEILHLPQDVQNPVK